MAEVPLKVEEWLPVGEDVREILERVKRIEQRPPCFYERFCKLAGRFLGRFTRDAKLSESTIKELEMAKLRVSSSEYWAGFSLAFAAPIVLGFALWMLGGLGEGLLDTYWLPIAGLSLGCIFGALFYFYPAGLAGIKRSEAQSQAIHTVLMAC